MERGMKIKKRSLYFILAILFWKNTLSKNTALRANITAQKDE